MAGVVAGVVGAYYVSGGSVFLTFVGALILVVALWPVFTPTTYLLDDKGITVRRPLRRDFRAWKSFRRYDVGPVNVLLSPFARPSRLDPFRGIVLRFANNKDEVIRFLAARLNEAAEEPDIWK